MYIVDRSSSLWSYMPSEVKGLVSDGEALLMHADHIGDTVSDYSYLVFPFAKAYEGFLKKLLLDLNLIPADMYYGDDIRIGRILNPYFIKEHDNVFKNLTKKTPDNQTVAQQLWDVWKTGRNEVFHYFPHNFRRLRYKEAMDIINDIIAAMTAALSASQL